MLTVDIAKGSHQALWLFKGGVKRFLVYSEGGKWFLAKPGKDETPSFDTLFDAMHAAINTDKLEESARRLAGTAAIEAEEDRILSMEPPTDYHDRKRHEAVIRSIKRKRERR